MHSRKRTKEVQTLYVEVLVRQKNLVQHLQSIKSLIQNTITYVQVDGPPLDPRCEARHEAAPQN